MIFTTYGAYSQIPANPIGSNPHSLKWSQINTDKVQVIYPKGLDSVGLRVANMVHYLWDKDQTTMGTANEKVPILLHGYNVRSNAFVTVGPFRSEFYTVPPQFKNTMDWVDELTVHEYRHVQQFANATQGLTQMAKTIFGSWAWGGFMATALPRWYFEGDAVIAETGLSHSGRGRLPEFNMDYHALLSDDIVYSYEKAGAGSLKDMVPSWYPLGYNMLAYGRERYGADLWKDVAADAVKYKGLVYPFGKSLKKRTGLNPTGLYQATMADLEKRWGVIDKSKNSIAQTVPTQSKSTVTHYSHPLPLGDGTLLSVKMGYNRLFELVVIDADGGEKLLTNTGVLLDGSLTAISTSRNLVIWSELGYDARWVNRNYSELFLYDLATGSKRRLTKKSRYFSPDLSPDATKAVVVTIDDMLTQSIAIINTANGEMIDSYPGNWRTGVSYPKWIDHKRIAYVETKNQQNRILSYDVETDAEEILVDWTYDQISHMYVYQGVLYFSKADQAVNNIYSVRLDSGKLQKHSDALIGAFQPSVSNDGSQLYYAELKSDGYELKVEQLQSYAFSNKMKQPDIYHDLMTQQEGGDIMGDIPNEEFEITKFNKLSGIINPHSLIPVWNDPEVSLSILSDNTFGTLSAEVGAYYNYNENEFSYVAGLSYAEFYPIFNLSYVKSNRNGLFYNFSGLTDTSLVQRLFVEEWDENRINLGVTVPYTFSKGNMRNRITLRANYQNIDINIKDQDVPIEDIFRDTLLFSPANAGPLSTIYSEPISDQTIHAMDLRLTLSMFKLQALQHINPRFGLYLDARHRANIGDNLLGGKTTLLRGDLYLPGLRPNHSLEINGLYQKERILDNYRFSDQFIYARGYEFSLRRDEFYKVGVNYGFPIFYPDQALYGLAFLKRVKGNVFYDFGRYGISEFPFSQSYVNASSFGFELGFDVRALRLLEIDFGVRYSYLLNSDFAPQGNRHQFDFFVISISE